MTDAADVVVVCFLILYEILTFENLWFFVAIIANKKMNFSGGFRGRSFGRGGGGGYGGDRREGGGFGGGGRGS